MLVLHDTAELSRLHGSAFVPTMGALHAGHLALVHAAARSGRPVSVSIFVNPTQFGPGEDLDRYPRTPEADLDALEEAGVAFVFMPDAATVYPPDDPVPAPPLPAVATKPGLEDAHRPGHFQGVCQVVARLLDLVQPGSAHLGEKDYQQLQVIRAMVDAEGPRWPELAVESVPTVREDDGLALSSRNVYLDETARESALGLVRALLHAQSAADPPSAERVMNETLGEHGLQIDYAAVRDARTLLPITSYESPARALIAARVGGVRLIDNMGVG